MTTSTDIAATSMPGAETALERAALNIAALLGAPPTGCALLVCCAAKEAVSSAIAAALATEGLEVHVLHLADSVQRSGAALGRLVDSVAGSWGLVLLVGPQHAEWLFGAVGRPDRGIRPMEHLFCDWLLSADAVVRLYAVDADEQAGFQRRLRSRLLGAERIRITTPSGTDLRLTPRSWCSYPAGWGEVCTAPHEDSACGVIVVDGSAYYGHPAKPFVLRVARGRVTNLDELCGDDPHQRLALADLTRDPGASVVAELGLGTNLGARPDADIMEAEQARGTCHVGFGHNVAYGGANESATHVDFCLLRPTIRVDGATLCRGGTYILPSP